MENLNLFEILVSVLGVLTSIVGYYVQRLYHRIDRLEDKVEKVEDGLQNHRVEDAKDFVVKSELLTLRNDFHNSLIPLSQKLDSIEGFLRGRRNTD